MDNQERREFAGLSADLRRRPREARIALRVACLGLFTGDLEEPAIERLVRQAIYATGWEGTLTVRVNSEGEYRVYRQ